MMKRSKVKVIKNVIRFIPLFCYLYMFILPEPDAIHGAIFCFPIYGLIQLLFSYIANDFELNNTLDENIERKAKRERDNCLFGIFAGIGSIFSNAKKGLKDITDVDRWNTKV